MISRRDLALAAGGGVLLTLLVNPVTALYLGRRVPGGLPDPLGESWWLASAGPALIHHPAHFFQANASWPDDDTLARIDSLVGYSPIAVFAHGRVGLVLVYGLLFLFATALAFAGPFLLARVLGLARPAAVVTGIAFACAPYRLTQNGHLHMLSSGGIPLALALLILGYRRSNARLVLAGWLVAAWQMSLGFSLGVQLLYLLAILAGGALLWLWRSGRGLPARGVRLATIAGVASVCAVTSVLALPYLRVIASLPESPSVALPEFSSQPRSFLIAPGQSFFYKYRTADQRFALSAPDEQSLFPGLAIAALALLGVAAGSASRRLRWTLALATAWLAYASLGVVFLDGIGGYGIVRHLPGWTGFRVPSRLMTLTTLGLALLAGLGAQALWQRFRGRRPRHALALALVPIAIIAEGYGPVVTWKPFWPATKVSALPAPVLHLPASATIDPLYEFWSAADGFTPIANGASGTVIPAWVLQRYRAADSFPDAHSVAYLRALGVRSVVLRPALARYSPWQDAEQRPFGRLGIRRRHVGGEYIYDLRVPGS